MFYVLIWREEQETSCHRWNWLTEVCLELSQAAYHESAMEFGRICWRCLQGGLGRTSYIKLPSIWAFLGYQLSSLDNTISIHFLKLWWHNTSGSIEDLDLNSDLRWLQARPSRRVKRCTWVDISLKWLRPSKRICFNIRSPACKLIAYA